MRNLSLFIRPRPSYILGLDINDYDDAKATLLLERILKDNADKYAYKQETLEHDVPELTKYLYVEDQGTRNTKGVEKRFSLRKTLILAAAAVV